MDELTLMQEADSRALAYLETVHSRPAFPPQAAIDALSIFEEALPDHGAAAIDTLSLLDSHGGPATVANNGPNYFGFVIGATLPVAAAADRLALAWDQCASSFDGSPVAHVIERQAGRWLLDILDLPRDSAVAFGTSATACGLACLSAARTALLARAGWDFEADGLVGAPEIRVVVPETVHITVIKALRILGFGLSRIVRAPVDAGGLVDPARLPALDERTILCLQAGEVNTGGFDPFAAIIPAAKAAGAWVHVDGAFGLWARSSAKARHLTDGVEAADSWTTDGHKWLNTPYDGAVAICRDASMLARAMNSDAAYSSASADAQKNLTLEFSRKPRGIAIWAALRTLGRDGVAAMIDRHIVQAQRLAIRLRAAGYDVVNAVVLNQVLVRGRDDAATAAIRKDVQDEGEVWFGATTWQGRPAFRISFSSWRTQDRHVDRLGDILEAAIRRIGMHQS